MSSYVNFSTNKSNTGSSYRSINYKPNNVETNKYKQQNTVNEYDTVPVERKQEYNLLNYIGTPHTPENIEPEPVIEPVIEPIVEPIVEPEQNVSDIQLKLPTINLNFDDDIEKRNEEVYNIEDNEEYRSPGWARLKKKLLK